MPEVHDFNDSYKYDLFDGSDLTGSQFAGIYSSPGFRWDILSDGATNDGTSDAYDGGMTLSIQDESGGSLRFYNPSQSGILQQNGREIVLSSGDTYQGLSVTRAVFVPEEGTFARYFDSVTNTSDTVRQISLTIRTNLGSDGSETATTSSGDALFDSSDDWIVTVDDRNYDPTVTHVVDGPGGLDPSAATKNFDNVEYTYTLTLQPGETQSILHFAAQSVMADQATAQAAELTNPTGLALQGLTNDQLAQVVNFDLSYAITGIYQEGTTGNDTLVGGRGEDTLNGLSGNDVLYGRGGGDLLVGGSGADTFAGAYGELNGDTIGDFSSADVIQVDGAVAGATVSFADGVLTINPDGSGTLDPIAINLAGTFNGSFAIDGSGKVTFTPTAPTTGGGGVGGGGVSTTAGQVFNGTSGADTLNGTDGADTIFAGDGDDLILAGKGDDLVFGGKGNDTGFGGEGNDQMYAGEGDDVFAGGSGNDTLGGGAGADTLFGSQGDDAVFGGLDGDIAYGGTGNDKVYGGAGADTVLGGEGNDTLGGGIGDDQIVAGTGNDIVYGGAGNDTVFAGSGADLVYGGTGDDIIYLGAGDGTQDVFASVADNGSDRLFGFENGIDLLDLTGSGYMSFGEIASRIGQDGDGNATIDLGDGGLLTLVGIGQADLDEADFRF